MSFSVSRSSILSFSFYKFLMFYPPMPRFHAWPLTRPRLAAICEFGVWSVQVSSVWNNCWNRSIFHTLVLILEYGRF